MVDFLLKDAIVHTYFKWLSTTVEVLGESHTHLSRLPPLPRLTFDNVDLRRRRLTNSDCSPSSHLQSRTSDVSYRCCRPADHNSVVHPSPAPPLVDPSYQGNLLLTALNFVGVIQVALYSSSTTSCQAAPIPLWPHRPRLPIGSSPMPTWSHPSLLNGLLSSLMTQE